MENTNEKPLYNEQWKNDFLEGFDENTQQGYRRIFTESCKFEEELGKDISQFTVKESEPFFYSLEPLSVTASQSNVSVVSSYVEYLVEQGLKKNGINQFKGMPKEWIKKFVNDDIKVFITDRELRMLEDACNNPQDAVIFRMIFEGVQGKGCAEIVNLNKDDVGFDDGYLRLTDEDGTRRKLKVSDRCISLIEKALNQRDYMARNGETDAENPREYVELITNNYVVRNMKTRTDKINEPCDKHTVYRRFHMIKDVLGIEHLTVKSVSRSGMIKLAHDAILDHGEITKDDLEKIATRFNFNNVQAMKEFVNEETVKDVYGDAK